MKKNLYMIITLAVALFCLASCQRVEPAEDPAGEHTCELRLVGGIVPFDGGTKSAGAFSPSEENRLYVRMVGAAGPVLGIAKYNESTGTWSFTYNGTLGGATSGTAHAVLFERNIESETTHHVALRYNTPIYEDAGATFSVGQEGLDLHATLTPKTGRISFTHDMDEGSSRYFERLGGVSYYNSFSLSEFSFTSTDMADYSGMWLEGGNRGYIYGFFTDAADPQIFIYREESYFFRHMPPSVFQAGQSGYVTDPTTDMSGWRRFKSYSEFVIDGQNGSSGMWMSLRFVPGGTFRMGNDRDAAAAPAHEVTLGHYYIGAVEITRGLWYNVMGEPDYWAGDGWPACDKTYDEIQAFIAALNTNASVNGQYRFRLPTEAEWEFAARGGIFSQGYTYSGSNILTDIAVWQYDNPGATRNPNELNLYDMSGNKAELCSDWYGPYSEDAQVRPKGPESGTYRVIRGGSSWDPEQYCTVWHRSSTEEYQLPNSYVGFRVVAEIPPIDR